MESNGKLIAIEGMCCSGKTTLAKNLVKIALQNNFNKVIYNKGALSLSKFGDVVKSLSNEMSIAFSTAFYITDIIIDYKKTILPMLLKNNWVVQDRYIDSIISFRDAYSVWNNEYLDTSIIFEEIISENIIRMPDLTIYCKPALSVIKKRLKANINSSSLHSIYLENPRLLKLIYEKTYDRINDAKKHFVIDTSEPIDTKLIFKTIFTFNNES